MIDDQAVGLYLFPCSHFKGIVMKIPPFWAKEKYEAKDHEGRLHQFLSSGWSFESFEKAVEDAKRRAQRAFEVITRGEKPKDYDYMDRPLREEIVDRVALHGEEIGLVTRNRYGALVLNTEEVLFADVDFPEPEPVSMGFMDTIRSLFRPGKQQPKNQAHIDVTLDRIKGWAKQNPQRTFRLYRTLMGLRLLFTDKLYNPASEETRSLLEALETDPFYLKLTYKQECFRARLTPKPWRCGLERPPFAFPWSDEREEKAYRKWQHNYDAESAKYCACDFIGELGAPSEDEKIQAIIRFHDEHACGVGEKKMA